MTDSAERLEPCPFCRSTDLRHNVVDNGPVECCTCGASATSAYAWNRRAPAEAGAPEGWKPIETAPRDGTPILLFARGLHAQASIRLVGWWAYGHGWIEAAFAPNHPTGVVPSHWMPLPAAPAAPKD